MALIRKTYKPNKKPYKILIAVLIICIALFTLSFIVAAHSGDTDSQGGHYNHSTNEYHYHHGYPAHQHDNGDCPYETSIYWIIGIIIGIIVIPIVFIPLKECFTRKKVTTIDTSTQNKIDIIKKDTEMFNEKPNTTYLTKDNNHNLQTEALKTKLKEAEIELMKTKTELKRANEELLYYKKLVQNIKECPLGISFADDGMPIFWKPNPSKPYGDYTVWYSRKSHIYHTDKFCGSWDSNRTHIFNVIKIGRPCKKCAENYFDFTEIPDWFTEYFGETVNNKQDEKTLTETEWEHLYKTDFETFWNMAVKEYDLSKLPDRIGNLRDDTMLYGEEARNCFLSRLKGAIKTSNIYADKQWNILMQLKQELEENNLNTRVYMLDIISEYEHRYIKY